MSRSGKVTNRLRSAATALLAAAAGAAILILAAGWLRHSFAQEAAVSLPAPTLDVPPPADGKPQVAVLSGGCFWGVQAVYQHVVGVQQVLAGYSGGAADTAEYETVSTGRTGHAESVQIVFDPKRISYGQILRIFFSVVHDPTELDRQGPDEGTQYRSEVFYANPDQQRVAQAYIAQLVAAKVYPGRIVTRVDPLKGFYPAEDYHQDYLLLHPRQPYIVYNDEPKVEALKRMFPALWRQDPVTVAALKR